MSEKNSSSLQKRTEQIITTDRQDASSYYSRLVTKAVHHDKPINLAVTLLKIALRRLGKLNPRHVTRETTPSK